MAEVHTIALQVAYDGAPFCGFARQPGQLTVQGELEQALGLLYKRTVETTCAGRTDAGVHARGQVVSFDLDAAEFEHKTLNSLKRSLNALVDDAIAISAVTEVPSGFSARFDALSREYRYFIFQNETRPVLIDDIVWQIKQVLDIEAMRDAAQYIIGEHDFKSFCTAVSAEGKPTCRNVSKVDIRYEQLMGDQVIVIEVIGNAFLHSMVRTLVGTLVEVGKGKKKPTWMNEVLEACDRSAAGETAPAKGLVLWQVRYKTTIFP